MRYVDRVVIAFANLHYLFDTNGGSVGREDFEKAARNWAKSEKDYEFLLADLIRLTHAVSELG